MTGMPHIVFLQPAVRAYPFLSHPDALLHNYSLPQDLPETARELLRDLVFT